VIVVTGPHQVRGVELYRGRPIFYSMGDFAFEAEYIERFPAEVYELAGLRPAHRSRSCAPGLDL